MPKKQDHEYIQPSFDSVIEELPADNTFSIGQYGEETAATTLGCKRCGGTTFHVGSATYFTAIKCTSCGWERCINDG